MRQHRSEQTVSCDWRPETEVDSRKREFGGKGSCVKSAETQNGKQYRVWGRLRSVIDAWAGGRAVWVQEKDGGSGRREWKAKVSETRRDDERGESVECGSCG